MTTKTQIDVLFRSILHNVVLRRRIDSWRFSTQLDHNSYNIDSILYDHVLFVKYFDMIYTDEYVHSINGKVYSHHQHRTIVEKWGLIINSLFKLDQLKSIQHVINRIESMPVDWDPSVINPEWREKLFIKNHLPNEYYKLLYGNGYPTKDYFEILLPLLSNNIDTVIALMQTNELSGVLGGIYHDWDTISQFATISQSSMLKILINDSYPPYRHIEKIQQLQHHEVVREMVKRYIKKKSISLDFLKVIGRCDREFINSLPEWEFNANWSAAEYGNIEYFKCMKERMDNGTFKKTTQFTNNDSLYGTAIKYGHVECAEYIYQHFKPNQFYNSFLTTKNSPDGENTWLVLDIHSSIISISFIEQLSKRELVQVIPTTQMLESAVVSKNFDVFQYLFNLIQLNNNNEENNSNSKNNQKIDYQSILIKALENRDQQVIHLLNTFPYTISGLKCNQEDLCIISNNSDLLFSIMSPGKIDVVFQIAKYATIYQQILKSWTNYGHHESSNETQISRAITASVRLNDLESLKHLIKLQLQFPKPTKISISEICEFMTLEAFEVVHSNSLIMSDDYSALLSAIKYNKMEIFYYIMDNINEFTNNPEKFFSLSLSNLTQDKNVSINIKYVKMVWERVGISNQTKSTYVWELVACTYDRKLFKFFMDSYAELYNDPEKRSKYSMNQIEMYSYQLMPFITFIYSLDYFYNDKYKAINNQQCAFKPITYYQFQQNYEIFRERGYFNLKDFWSLSKLITYP